jgi:hypothetical protein
MSHSLCINTQIGLSQTSADLGLCLQTSALYMPRLGLPAVQCVWLFTTFMCLLMYIERSERESGETSRFFRL